MRFSKLRVFFGPYLAALADVLLNAVDKLNACTKPPMITIRFKFNPDKALQVLAYFLERLGATEKVKLMKLVYLADKESFLRHGAPITGDRQCAMPWGPVASRTLGMLDGEIVPPDRVFQFLHISDNLVSVRKSPGRGLLTDEEVKTLDGVAASHGHKQRWKLVKETHQLPEYVESYVEGSSRPIPYEDIARHGANESRYRCERPVISPETAAQMDCPLSSGADL